MSFFTVISDSFLSVCSIVAKAIRATNETVNFVFHVNYEVVSAVYYSISLVIVAALYILQSISHFVSGVLQYSAEFINELIGCVCALFVLLWRILVLVYKVICFVLTGLETLAIALWTGSYVTVTTLKKSAVDISDYCGSTWNHAIQMTQELFCGMINLFSSIGNSALDGLWVFLQYILCTFYSGYDVIVYSFQEFEYFVKNFFSNIIYFYTAYLPSLGKETYLGILICCLLYLGCIKLLFYLNYHGMTLFTRQQRAHNQFGELTIWNIDNEDLSDNDQNESVVSDSSEYQEGTEANDSDDMSEHTVDDNDDDDSELSLNSQTFSSSDEDDDEIEVELPTVSDHYGLRNRSMTPNRNKNISPEEFEREIEKEKDKRKCVVCQDQSKSVLILPCRHMCLCVQCANQIIRARFIERRVCPLCRRKIQKVMDVYT